MSRDDSGGLLHTTSIAESTLNTAKISLKPFKYSESQQVTVQLTSPSAYSVLSTLAGDKKSLVLRFFALLSLNQSFSGSEDDSLSPPSLRGSRALSRCPRSAEPSARTVGVIRRARDGSMLSMSSTTRTGELATRPSAPPRPVHTVPSHTVGAGYALRP